MKTLLGAVAGALACGAVLVAYDLGEHHTFNQDAAAMSAGYQYQPGLPYAVQAGQTGYVSPYAPYGTPFAGPYPYGVAGPTTPMAMAPMPGYAVPQYVNQPVVTAPAGIRRVASERSYETERVSTPQRSWQKSALLIAGSAAGSAGVGALIGGKKGAGIGALVGGGTAAIYDQIKRH
jgi:hypothetical protein